jgi:hypothetical protein
VGPEPRKFSITAWLRARDSLPDFGKAQPGFCTLGPNDEKISRGSLKRVVERECDRPEGVSQNDPGRVQNRDAPSEQEALGEAQEEVGRGENRTHLRLAHSGTQV